MEVLLCIWSRKSFGMRDPTFLLFGATGNGDLQLLCVSMISHTWKSNRSSCWVSMISPHIDTFWPGLVFFSIIHGGRSRSHIILLLFPVLAHVSVFTVMTYY